MKAEDTLAKVLSCEETGLSWKKMLSITCTIQWEKAWRGHTLEVRSTLSLCTDTSTDLKIKLQPVYHSQTSHVLKEQKVDKDKGLSHGGSVQKSESQGIEWVQKVFVPTIKKYLSDNPLPEVCLLLMDTSLAHPPASVDDMDVECDFREAKFLPAQHDASSAAHGPASNLTLQEAVRKGALHQVFQYH